MAPLVYEQTRCRLRVFSPFFAPERGGLRRRDHPATVRTTLPRVWPDIWAFQASAACDSGYVFVTTVRIVPASSRPASSVSAFAEGCICIILACTLCRAAHS